MTRSNAELANSFGNLAQRTLSMIFKNMDGILKSDCAPDPTDVALASQVSEAVTSLQDRFEALDFSAGLEAWMRAVFACNQYVDEMAPWALRKSDPARMEAVLMTLFRQVRALAIAVRPVVPAAMDKLLDQLGSGVEERDYAALDDGEWFPRLAASGFTVAKPEGVFPRLELPEGAPA